MMEKNAKIYVAGHRLIGLLQLTGQQAVRSEERR